MKCLLIFISGLFIFCTQALSSDSEAAKKGLEIAKQCDQANSGYGGETSRATMLLYNSGGQPVERALKIKRKEIKNVGERSILTFLRPADVKGSKLLTWSNQKSEDDQWLYLPPLKRVKRITSRVRSGSFLGSEFSYEDFGAKEVSKYHHKFLREEDLDQRKTWVLEQKAKNANSGYSKEIAWMDKEYRVPLKVEFYDRKGELLKVSHFEDFKKHQKWWKPSKITMDNVQTRNKSVMVWSDVQLNVALSKEDFDSGSLKE